MLIGILIAAVFLVAILGHLVKTTLPSKGHTFVQQSQETNASVRARHDTIHKKPAGDFNERELVEKTYGTVPQSEQTSDLDLLGSHDTVTDDGGNSEGDGGSTPPVSSGKP